MTPQERNIWVRRMERAGVVGSPPRAGRRARVGDCRRASSLLDRARLSDPQDTPSSFRPAATCRTRSCATAATATDHGVRLCRMRLRLPCGRPAGDAARRRDAFASELADEMAAANVPTELGAIVAHADMRNRISARCSMRTRRRRRTRPWPSAQRGTPRGLVGATIAGAAPSGPCLDPDFRRGMALVGEWGLTFDAFLFELQLGELIALAEAVPQTTIVVNHLGGPIGFDPRRRATRTSLPGPSTSRSWPNARMSR